MLLGVSDPGPALLLVDHLPDVFAHKLTLGGKRAKTRLADRMTQQHVCGGHFIYFFCVYLLDIVDAAEAPTSRQRPEDLHLAVLTPAERLVEAALAGRANLRRRDRVLNLSIMNQSLFFFFFLDQTHN